jgi:WD40 repeat protein
MKNNEDEQDNYLQNEYQSALASHFFSVYHDIVHSATAKPNDVEVNSHERLSLKYSFVDVDKEQETLEQVQSQLIQRRDQLFRQVEELNHLMKKIHEKKMEIQIELEKIDQRQTSTYAECKYQYTKSHCIYSHSYHLVERVKSKKEVIKRNSTTPLSDAPDSPRPDTPRDGELSRRPSLPIFLASTELVNNMFRLHSFTFNSSKKTDNSYLTLKHIPPSGDNELNNTMGNNSNFAYSTVIKSKTRNGVKSKQTFDILSVKLLPSSKVISGSSDGFIRIWDISHNRSTPEYQIHAHKGWVRCLATDPDAQNIVTGGGDSSLHLYSLNHLPVDLNSSKDEDDLIANYIDVADDGLICKKVFYGHSGGITCVQLDESVLVSGSVDKEIKLWDVTTGTCVRTLSGHKSYVKALQLYFHGLASAGGEESEIKLWDMRQGKCIRTFFGHDGGVTVVKFDHHKIVSGGRSDGAVKVFDLRTGGLLDTIYVGSCSIDTPTNKTGASGNMPAHYRRNSIHNMNVAQSPRASTPRPRSTSHTEELLGLSQQSVTSLKFLNDQLIFAARGLQGPVLYDMKTRTPVRQFIGHTSLVNDLDFNANCLTTASRDLTVKIWNL